MYETKEFSIAQHHQSYRRHRRPRHRRPGAAHARLLMGTPKNGATVAAPKALTLKYSEGLVPAASSVKVATPLAPRSEPPHGPRQDKKIVTVPSRRARRRRLQGLLAHEDRGRPRDRRDVRFTVK